MEGMSSSGGLEIGISCFTEPHFGTGGQKHTHKLKEISFPPGCSNGGGDTYYRMVALGECCGHHTEVMGGGNILMPAG
jgi:hypothetical protein